VIIPQLPTIAIPQNVGKVNLAEIKRITASMIMDGNGQLANQAVFAVAMMIVPAMIQKLN